MYHSSTGRASSPAFGSEQITIDFAEDPSWYRESIAYAKQNVEEKPHIPPEQKRLVFNAPAPMDDSSDDVEMFMNSNWVWDDASLLSPHEHYTGKDASIMNLEQRLAPVPQEGFDDLFLTQDDVAVQEPAFKKQKVEQAQQPLDRNQILSLLISEQKKQGEEITQLKEMVQHLTRQVEERIMNNQFAAYQVHQQQLYQQYQQQNARVTPMGPPKGKGRLTK
jgi:hypothetical protein